MDPQTFALDLLSAQYIAYFDHFFTLRMGAPSIFLPQTEIIELLNVAVTGQVNKVRIAGMDEAILNPPHATMEVSNTTRIISKSHDIVLGMPLH